MLDAKGECLAQVLQWNSAIIVIAEFHKICGQNLQMIISTEFLDSVGFKTDLEFESHLNAGSLEPGAHTKSPSSAQCLAAP